MKKEGFLGVLVSQTLNNNKKSVEKDDA